MPFSPHLVCVYCTIIEEYAYTYMYMYMCVHVQMYMYMCVHVQMYMYVIGTLRLQYHLHVVYTTVRIGSKVIM